MAIVRILVPDHGETEREISKIVFAVRLKVPFSSDVISPYRIKKERLAEIADIGSCCLVVGVDSCRNEFRCHVPD